MASFDITEAARRCAPPGCEDLPTPRSRVQTDCPAYHFGSFASEADALGLLCRPPGGRGHCGWSEPLCLASCRHGFSALDASVAVGAQMYPEATPGWDLGFKMCGIVSRTAIFPSRASCAARAASAFRSSGDLEL